MVSWLSLQCMSGQMVTGVVTRRRGAGTVWLVATTLSLRLRICSIACARGATDRHSTPIIRCASSRAPQATTRAPHVSPREKVLSAPTSEIAPSPTTQIAPSPTTQIAPSPTTQTAPSAVTHVALSPTTPTTHAAWKTYQTIPRCQSVESYACRPARTNGSCCSGCSGRCGMSISCTPSATPFGVQGGHLLPALGAASACPSSTCASFDCALPTSSGEPSRFWQWCRRSAPHFSSAVGTTLAAARRISGVRQWPVCWASPGLASYGRSARPSVTQSRSSTSPSGASPRQRSWGSSPWSTPSSAQRSSTTRFTSCGSWPQAMSSPCIATGSTEASAGSTSSTRSSCSCGSWSSSRWCRASPSYTSRSFGSSTCTPRGRRTLIVAGSCAPTARSCGITPERSSLVPWSCS
mmetsp:Transcript_125513/g.349384  ORF Transcript_125513/g.349384 Transcript_125513/m.349384 type:complete len:408 (+) Transcript_125513:216-1439(+)